MEHHLVIPSRHTRGHINCPVCARATNLMQLLDLSPAMTFAEAFEAWIERRVITQDGIQPKARYIAERTEQDLRQYKRAAAKFFGQLRLEEIHAGHLHTYQRLRVLNPDDPDGTWRAVRGQCVQSFASYEAAEAWVRDRQGWKLCRTVWERPAGANLVRKEVQTVVRVMKAAGAWGAHHEEAFECLQVEATDVQRAMTPDEQHAWLHVAASRQEWRVVYWWSLIALQTTMSTNELRALRLADVFLEQGVVQVRREGAKNKFRLRTIPLQTPEVVWAFDQLIARARSLGARAPHHFLFPLHITADRYDPDRPMTVWGLRRPWDAVREASGIAHREKSGVVWPRMYDLRHTAITRMAEAGVPIQVIMSFAGHISRQMQQHYTTISMEAKRRWAMATWASQQMPYALPASMPARDAAVVEEFGGGPGGMKGKKRGRWVWQEEGVAV